jgi:sugar phosphate isomerase/epimerase
MKPQARTFKMTEQKKAARYPKLHNAMWPGLVGKGSPGAEACISLDTMLELTAQARVGDARFDGVDLFLFDPHVSIDLDDDGIQRLADKISNKGFVVGSVVAPVWGPTGGGSAIGEAEERTKFLHQVRKACRIASTLRQIGARPYGVVRIDSACSPAEWLKDPAGNQKKIARTFSNACDIAEDFGERLAAEGEICWGGMHSWKHMLNLLEMVNRPKTLGFQADMAHTLLYAMGHNAPEHSLLPAKWNWSRKDELDAALTRLTAALRPWTIDFHVAQNDATVHGSGTHDKTGHHCLPDDPAGKLDIAKHAGYWLRGKGAPAERGLQHICWDGCMFSNETMMRPQTWNDILAAMIEVRDTHGWDASSTDRISESRNLRPGGRRSAVSAAKRPAKSRKRTQQQPTKPNSSTYKKTMSAKKAKAAKKPAKKAATKKAKKK